MLNSVSDIFPNGLGNGSDQLGRNLMDHHYRVGASGIYDGFKDMYVYGRRANGVYILRFRNINEPTKQKEYLRGFGYQAGAGRGIVWWNEGFGEAFKERLTEPGEWSMWMGGWGEHLPYPDNRVMLNKEKKDEWGLPLADIDCEFKENEKAMRKDIMNCGVEMLEKAGLKNIQTFDDEKSYPGLCIHEMGTARMGHDPKTSVLNKWNQVN